MTTEGKPLRVAIVGTGWGAKVQVAAFRWAGLTVRSICSSLSSVDHSSCLMSQVSALCGRRQDHTEKLCQEMKIPIATADYKAILSNSQPASTTAEYIELAVSQRRLIWFRL